LHQSDSYRLGSVLQVFDLARFQTANRLPPRIGFQGMLRLETL
jgi:hypothetical protein